MSLIISALFKELAFFRRRGRSHTLLLVRQKTAQPDSERLGRLACAGIGPDFIGTNSTDSAFQKSEVHL